MEEPLFNIASRLKKPLAYGGVTLIVLFLLYRVILRLNIFSPLGEDKTFALLNNIANLLFFMAIIGVAFSAFSYILENRRQTYVIRGNVQFNNGMPVKGATVYVIGAESRKETNTEGLFDIKVDRQDSWIVRAQFKGKIAEKKVVRKDILEPIILTIEGAEKIDARKSVQSHGLRSDKYDNWYQELSKGELSETSLISSKEVEILTRTLDKVLKEKRFGSTTISRTEVVFNELVTNVARHVKNGEITVKFEINTSQLPYVDVSVADNGEGYDVLRVIEEQALNMKSGEREHGIGLVSRLSDKIYDHPNLGPSGKGLFTINCTLYDIPWPGSVADGFPWCGKVIIDYSSPPSVWFGNDRYAIWWRLYDKGHSYSIRGAAQEAFLYAINNDIRPLLDIYLGPLRLSNPSYLFFEIRNHGGTEPSPSSWEIISDALEIYFPEYFNERKVLLFSLESGYDQTLSWLAAKYGLKLNKSQKSCLHELEVLNDQLDTQN
jgi:anti-sigma regulatory factor (Ser/Thr protein kinase)